MSTSRRPFADATARRHAPRDRAFDLRHLRLELRLDPEGRSLQGTATQSFRVLDGTARSLELDCVDLEVRGVSGADGKPLPWWHSGEVLRVELPRACAPGEQLELTVEYAGSPRAGLWFIAPDAGYPDKPRQVWSQGEQTDTRRWIPTWDEPTVRCSSELVVTVPASWTAFSNGRLVATREEPGGRERTFHWLQEKSHVPYLVALAAGEMDVVESRSPSGTPLVYAVPRGRKHEIELALGRTPEMLEFFSAWTGVPFPWDKYAQVVVNDFTYGGMENTSCTILTDRALHDERARPDYRADGLVAHELAHQWWGDLVTCRAWEHVWLNEGFATYAEALWKEHAEGADEMAFNLLDKADRYLAEAEESYRRPIVTSRYTDPGDLFDRHAYEKAALVLHMLRRELGDDAYREGIRAWLERHRERVAETAELRLVLEETSGRSLAWFFEQWLERPGHPELAVRTRWEERPGQLAVEIEQTQEREDGTPVFRLPLVVRLWHAEGPVDHRVLVDAAQQTAWLPCPRPPLAVTVDPGNALLKRLRFERPVEALALEVERAEAAIDRALACRALALSSAPRAVAVLARALAGDRFWGVRAQAAKALGRSRAEGALEALLPGLEDSDSRVRSAAAEGLGELKDRRAVPALERLLDGDPRDYPRAEAARALGRIGGEGAVDRLRAALAHASHQEVIRFRALEALPEAGDRKAAVALAREWSAYGRPPRAREAALKALGKLGREEPEVRAWVEEIAVRDPNIWARRAALEALGELRDPASLPVLERAAQVELDSRLRRDARLALALVRSRGTGDEGLRRELEELRETARRIERRFGSVEARVEERK